MSDSPNSVAAAPRAGGRPQLSVRKKLLFALAVVVGLPVFLLGLGELAARAYVYLRYGKPDHSYGIYMADDELGATHRPHSYNSNSVINNWGLRNTEDITEKKPAGALRVYCSGGSTTFCYNLDTDDSWPSLLQRDLRRLPGHERDEVLNAGQICFSVAQEYCLARRLIPRLKPDVVIVFSGINELLAAQIIAYQDGLDLDRLLGEERWGVCAKHLDQARFWKRNSVLMRLWDYRVKKLFEKQATASFEEATAPAEIIHPWVVANFEHTLHDYLAFLQDQGCKVVVLRYGDNGKDSWHLKSCIRVLRDRAVEIGREEGVTICDLVPRVDSHPRRRDLYTHTGIHVSREGAELYAAELCKVLTGTTEAGSSDRRRPGSETGDQPTRTGS
jgi:hypothetical protein